MSCERARVVADIAAHTIRAAQRAEALGGWRPVRGRDLFEVEYWELEQAKLRRWGTPAPLQGKVAVVSGAASGIGRASVDALLEQGAAVAGFDIDPEVTNLWERDSAIGIRCDVTEPDAVDRSIRETVRRFGGLDVVVANAGIFPRSQRIEEMDDKTWAESVDVNLTGHLRLLRSAIPFLKLGIDPAVIIVASKNVPAPGPGAAAYSVAKAALTQLARVAALELGRDGIRVNVIHPNAVFDTAIWTEEVLRERARAYGMTVEQYRRNNVLGVQVSSRDVAALAAAMAGSLFSKTTGAQVPVDGGNERVI